MWETPCFRNDIKQYNDSNNPGNGGDSVKDENSDDDPNDLLPLAWENDASEVEIVLTTLIFNALSWAVEGAKVVWRLLN